MKRMKCEIGFFFAKKLSRASGSIKIYARPLCTPPPERVIQEEKGEMQANDKARWDFC